MNRQASGGMDFHAATRLRLKRSASGVSQLPKEYLSEKENGNDEYCTA